MDMKTIFRFGLIALAALAMSSCAKETVVDQVNPDTPIEFGTYLGRAAQTKGSVATLDAAAVGLQATGFGVYGYYTNGADYTSDLKPNFMVNEQMTYSADKWTYSPVKYWPNETNDKLSFFAYAPYYDGTAATENITAVSTKGASGDPTVTFAVATDVTKQIDLLYASASNQTKPNVGTSTTLNFQHALSRVGFKGQVLADIKNEDATGTDDDSTAGAGTLAPGTKVVINNITLAGNFYTGGTLNLNTGVFTGAGSSASYSLALTDLQISELTNTTESELLNKTSEFMMLIPRDDVTMSVTVDYDVITTDNALDGGESKINNVITSSDFTLSLEKGKAYTLVLHIGLKSVELSAQVTDWAEQDETAVNVPVLS